MVCPKHEAVRSCVAFYERLQKEKLKTSAILQHFWIPRLLMTLRAVLYPDTMKRILRLVLRTLVVFFILLNIMAAFHAYKFTHFYDASEVHIKLPEEKDTWDKISEVMF